MAAEAEAAREARAKVIAAEGEMKASRALKEAADVIAESPAALQVIMHFASFHWFPFMILPRSFSPIIAFSIYPLYFATK